MRMDPEVREALKYPEIEKQEKIRKEATVIAGFLLWLQDSDYALCRWAADFYHEGGGGWVMAGESIDTWLARYFDTDLATIENEKRQMLAEIRENARAEMGTIMKDGTS